MPSGNLSGEYGGIVFFQTRPRAAPVKPSLLGPSRLKDLRDDSGDGTNGRCGTKMSSASSPTGQNLPRVVQKHRERTRLRTRAAGGAAGGRSWINSILRTGNSSNEAGIASGDRKEVATGAYQAIATLDYGGKTGDRRSDRVRRTLGASSATRAHIWRYRAEKDFGPALGVGWDAR